MGKGRRYEDGGKLNMKKVVGVIVAIAAIIMGVVSINILLKNGKSREVIKLEYFASYDNNKWGVINSLGEEVVHPSYDEMIIVPDSSKNVFICTYDVDYQAGTYKTKAINEKEEILFGTYETVESLKLLDGLVDVYLPDLKYYNDTYAIKYSKAPNYFFNATKAIEEMYRQVGSCKFDNNGNILKGVIVRHLMLPTLKNDSKKILKYLYDTYKDNIYISIMNQYTILNKLPYKELNHKVKEKDYDEIIDFAISIGIKNAFCQLDNTSNKSFIPNFDLEGV